MTPEALRRGFAMAASASALMATPCVSGADTTEDASPVQCIVQSARLDFGRLGLHRPHLVAGQGEAVVACLNATQQMRHVELWLTFPTMGPQTAALQSRQGSLAVRFYQDAQFATGWSEDRGGAALPQAAVDLGPGERKVLRLPVYALLQNPQDAAADLYLLNLPITVTTVQK